MNTLKYLILLCQKRMYSITFLCTGNHTKFIAKTTSIAQEWVESIREGITQEQERERREVQHQ